jgi:PilZ domain
MSSLSMPVVDDILSLIRYLGYNNLPIKLSKSFREMVLHQDVSILEAGSDSATFRATDVAMCAALEGTVYLHNLLFPKPVAARVEHRDLTRGIFILSGFTYIETDWRERQHERVRPRTPTYVNLRWRGKALRTPLDNISANGMGLLVYKLFERGIEIQPGMNLQLDFQLPPDYSFMGLKGTIVYLRAVGGSLVKTGVQLFPKAREAYTLEKYVAQRKREILQELEQAYCELCKPRGVESLFF